MPDSVDFWSKFQIFAVFPGLHLTKALLARVEGIETFSLSLPSVSTKQLAVRESDRRERLRGKDRLKIFVVAKTEFFTSLSNVQVLMICPHGKTFLIHPQIYWSFSTIILAPVAHLPHLLSTMEPPALSHVFYPPSDTLNMTWD